MDYRFLYFRVAAGTAGYLAFAALFYMVLR